MNTKFTDFKQNFVLNPSCNEIIVFFEESKYLLKVIKTKVTDKLKAMYSVNAYINEEDEEYLGTAFDLMSDELTFAGYIVDDSRLLAVQFDLQRFFKDCFSDEETSPINKTLFDELFNMLWEKTDSEEPICISEEQEKEAFRNARLSIFTEKNPTDKEICKKGVLDYTEYSLKNKIRENKTHQRYLSIGKSYLESLVDEWLQAADYSGVKNIEKLLTFRAKKNKEKEFFDALQWGGKDVVFEYLEMKKAVSHLMHNSKVTVCFDFIGNEVEYKLEALVFSCTTNLDYVDIWNGLTQKERKELMSIYKEVESNASGYSVKKKYVKRISYRGKTLWERKEKNVQNTKVSYLYRDADNYKVCSSEIIEGEISYEKMRQIDYCLKDGEFFIPHQVGLPTSRFETITESDHPWFELHPEFDFTYTDEAPTVNMTVDEFTECFVKAKDNWDESME